MSRSKKKSPVITDNVSKAHKRLSNKRIRRSDFMTNGKCYKKVLESWDIHDWKIRHSDPDYKVMMK